MKLQFLKPYPNSSITEKFEDIELNDFAVITGKNGVGKTHLLEAIVHNDNYITIDEGTNVIYFNYNDFIVENTKTTQQRNKSQLKKKNGNANSVNQELNNIRGLISQKVYSPLVQSFKEQNQLVAQVYNYLLKRVSFLDVPSWKNARIELLKYSTDEELIKKIYDKYIELINIYSQSKDEYFDKYYDKANRVNIPFQQLQNTHLEYQETWLGQFLEKEFKEYIKNYEKAKKKVEHDNHDDITIREIKQKAIEEVGNAPWSLLNDVLQSYSCNGYIIDEDLVNTIDSFVDINQQPLDIKLKNYETGKVISLDRLSSGEKTLFALAVSLYRQEKDETLPTVLLLDEIDSSLHPSMCKQLLNVLENIFVKKYGLKIIMVTHSPSTVALAPENSVYIMGNDNGKANLINKNNSEAVQFLSDGFATINDGKILFENIINSQKDLILFTEGETDITHINTAKEKLNVNDLDFDIYSCDCADKLKQFLMGIPKGLAQDKKIVGIFDYDDEGLKCAKALNGVVKEKSIYKRKDVDNVYSITLPCPNDNLITFENCPIEFLYDKEKLPTKMLEKRSLKDVNNKLNADIQIGSAEFEKKEDLHFHRLKKNADKRTFSEQIKEFEKNDFKNFKPLFEKLKILN